MVDSDHGRVISEAKNKTPVNKTGLIGGHPFPGVELDLTESIFHDEGNSTKFLINSLMGLYVHPVSPVAKSVSDWIRCSTDIDDESVPSPSQTTWASVSSLCFFR
jgi:hypothetical protein